MIRIAQGLLVIAAGALWVASRLPWVAVGSADGLGPAKITTLNGAAWSTALLPLAVLILAAALAALAVRGWAMRLVAVLLAVVSFGLGYLGITLITMRDVGPRGAALAGVEVANLVSSERHLAGAFVTLGSAVAVLAAAVLLMRSAVSSAPLSTSPPARPGLPPRTCCPSEACGMRSTRARTRPPTVPTGRAGDGCRRSDGYPFTDIGVIARHRQRGSESHEFGNRARLHSRGSPC